MLGDKTTKTYTGDCIDKVFVLNSNDAKKYFERANGTTSSNYHAITTEYALSRAKQDAIEKMSISKPGFNKSFIRWWLLSNKESKRLAYLSGANGLTYFKTDEADISYAIGGYRPSVWVDLSLVSDAIRLVQ